MIYAYLPSFSILIKGKYKFSNGLSKINYRTFLCLIPQVYLTLLLSYYLIIVYWYPTHTFTNETTSPRPKKMFTQKGVPNEYFSGKLNILVKHYLVLFAKLLSRIKKKLLTSYLNILYFCGL